MADRETSASRDRDVDNFSRDETLVRLETETTTLLYKHSRRLYWHQAISAFHPSGVGKWVPASAGKANAGMVHSVSGWTRGVQVKLWDPLRTRAIPERLIEVCSREGAIQIHLYTFRPPHCPSLEKILRVSMLPGQKIYLWWNFH